MWGRGASRRTAMSPGWQRAAHRRAVLPTSNQNCLSFPHRAGDQERGGSMSQYPCVSVLWLDPGPVWIPAMGICKYKFAHFGCSALQQSPVHIPQRKDSSSGEAITAISQHERNGDGSQGHPVLLLLGTLVMVEMAGANGTPAMMGMTARREWMRWQGWLSLLW